MVPTTTIPVHRAATVAMGTVVSIQVVTDQDDASVRPALQRALTWFATVEKACSRVDPSSELRRLVARTGEPVRVSPVLFEAVQLAVDLARATGGIVDPTIRHGLEQRRVNRHDVTGQVLTSPDAAGGATYRDVCLGAGRTIRLRRPLVLDLGAVARGLALDLASCELTRFENFCVEAGGALFAGGHDVDGEPWRIGVQGPGDPGALATTLAISDRAVCTSGVDERTSTDGSGDHLLHPRTGESVAGLASLSVVAATATAADGLATAAFILGLDAGRRLLEQAGVVGVFITPTGEIHRTTTGGERRPC